MRFSEAGAPVSSSDGDHAQLRDDDGSADGSRDFFGRLNAEPNVTLRVADDDDGFETRALTGARLLLDWFDLNFIESAK